MAFRVHGAEQHRRWIESTLGHARLLAGLIRDDREFELLHDPQLSTLCFRHLPPDIVDGTACLRVCFVSFRTSRELVPTILEVARELG
jgi:aromatic-L-amino-acid decarboxylase